MKLLKNLFLILVLGLSSSIIFDSCKEDPCENVTCLNGGICNEGICECADGYEGENCSDSWRDKMIRNYDGQSICEQTPSDMFFATIEADNSCSNCNNSINISIDLELEMNAELITSTTFNIPTQIIYQDQYIELMGSGSGTYNPDGTITIELVIDDGTISDYSCTLTLTP